MRKPRDPYTQAEREEIDRRAQAAMERFAESGDYVSYETCWMMAELRLVTLKVEEIKAWLESVANDKLAMTLTEY